MLTEAEQELILEHPMSYHVDKLLTIVLERGKRIGELLASAQLNTDLNLIDDCLKTSKCIVQFS